MCDLTLELYALMPLTAEQSGLFERGRPIRFAGRGLTVDGQPCFISESQRGAERLAAVKAPDYCPAIQTPVAEAVQFYSTRAWV
jgi:hypothetical protein